MNEFWVFGYGSLMWRPGFAFAERREATLVGAHRRLCVYSHVHRGTPDRPGLVLGLDRGGSCRGMAFRVMPEQWEETLAYLREREQATMVYREAWRTVTLPATDDAPAREARALAYLVDRRHPQYAGHIGADEQLPYVLNGHGRSGPCPDYVRNTVVHLREMGIADPLLERLVALMDDAAQTV
ncbi:gamma-glutamylcyclotransferase [Kaustia mangrovi]|uniref:glutathione-specific gamma-glutamylcyclotransferase n=2 Tax=Kaustia mangrovi TaxID=2593653 RepID=A0A7S8C870_9HYPH|nr:gamma-glutamylcyclotransferase [Kaustia mangrovi]